MDTRKHTEEIRTEFVDSCGEDYVKLKRRKKLLQNIILSIPNVQAILD